MSSRKPKKTQQSDSSNTVQSIDDLSSKFNKPSNLETELIRLKDYVAGQEATIELLLAQIKEKDLQLDEIIKQKQSVVERVPVSQEEIIAEHQLNKIRQKAEAGLELTLEEARKFEIFAKIKNAAKENSPPAFMAAFTNINSKEELRAIAQSPNIKAEDE